MLALPHPPLLAVRIRSTETLHGERWLRILGIGFSVLLHAALAWAWMGVSAAPLDPPPPRLSGEPSSEALTVWLLSREQARPSRHPVPPMPQPPTRPREAAPLPPKPAERVPTADVPQSPPIHETPVSLPIAAEPERVPAATVAPASPPEPVSATPEPRHATPPPTGPRARRAQQRYLRELMAWLARHRTYPDAAKKAKLQGIVHVRFTLDRTGRLLAAAVDRGPGVAILEQAAIDVLQRANPMPPIPESMGLSRLTLTLPIEYSLLTD